MSFSSQKMRYKNVTFLSLCKIGDSLGQKIRQLNPFLEQEWWVTAKFPMVCDTAPVEWIVLGYNTQHPEALLVFPVKNLAY